MATRIDIELTSRQDDGATFTWRAAGARQPKGTADASLFPAGSEVGDEFRVETEMDLDGIHVTAVVPSKEKPVKTVETIQLLGSGDDVPLVTQQLAPKGRRGDHRDRKPRRGKDHDRGGDRERSGGDRERSGGDRERGEGRRDSRPRTPAKPKLPPKPKPPRLKAGKQHRNTMLDALPDEERAVAQELVRGGLQAVRQGLAAQNEQRKTEGKDPIDEGPILGLAESLLQRVRAAEWLDRAEAAIEQAETVDLRDLRSVVTAADGAAKDDETRALAARLRTALNERLDADQQAWIGEVVEMLDDDRVVRALHLSSRPPKAGAPLPAPVAMRLVEAANAAMNAETSPDRWTYVLDALAHSPVRRQVVPVSLPTNVTDELRRTIARHGTRLPEIAQIFGIEPDAKAARADGGKGRKRRGGKPTKGGEAESGTAPTEAAPAEVVSTEAASTEAAPVEAVPTEAASTEAAPVEVESVEVESVEVESTEVVSTEAAPVEAAPAEPAED